jgi:hypothetical protein
MKSNFLAFFVTLALLGVSQASATTLLGTPSNASGVDGLIVDGVSYNVAFIRGSYSDAYAVSPPPFLFAPDGARDASIALDEAFRALAVTGLFGFPANDLRLEFVLVPFSPQADVVTVYEMFCHVTCSDADWYVSGLTQVVSIGSTLPVSKFAVFAPSLSTTPLPSAITFFAPGLAVLGLLAWRRKRDAAAALAAA